MRPMRYQCLERSGSAPEEQLLPAPCTLQALPKPSRPLPPPPERRCTLQRPLPPPPGLTPVWQVLKRLVLPSDPQKKKEACRPHARMIAKVAHANPLPVLETIVMQVRGVMYCTA